MRQSVYHILEGVYLPFRLGIVFSWFMATLIVLNVIALILETEASVYAGWRFWFNLFEAASVTLFTLDYIARMWACVEQPEYAGPGPVKGRLRYALTPLAVFDLLAIAPFFLGFILPGADLRLLRAFRLLRLLKLTRYSQALQSLGHVAVRQRRELVASVLVMAILLMFCSSGIYFLERHIQPEAFASIPRAMWWAMATLTTVGYGDVAPVTALGKIFGAFSMVLGIGMFALPTGILATGFTEELQRRDFVVTWRMVAGVPLFNALSVEDIADLIGQLHPASFNVGDWLIEPGGGENRMVFLIQGKALAEGQGAPDVLSAGAHLGEKELLSMSRGTLSLRALTDCRALILMRDGFEEFARTHPRAYQTLIDTARRVNAAEAVSE